MVAVLPNWIGGLEMPASATFEKKSPVDGRILSSVAKSTAKEVDLAVRAARAGQAAWANVPPVQRGAILFEICRRLGDRKQEMAKVVSEETGKSMKDALGETEGAIQLGRFYAGEGQRLYGKTTTSGVSNKYAMTVREPCGVAALIVAANTPIANVAWKVFPALICGNAVVLKAAEDTPNTAHLFAAIAHLSGLPAGALNVVQGLGSEAGAALVDHNDIDVLSFTGSTAVGKEIAKKAADRFLKVSLECGGKNPLVVCDDADLSKAVKWICLSAFSNAGQRCAAASRIIVFESVYDKLKMLLVEAAKKLRVGPNDDDDFGPVINERQVKKLVAAVEAAKKKGATVLAGGNRLSSSVHAKGFFMEPTLLENVGPDDEISQTELFGPVAVLYKVKDFEAAVSLANWSSYGLTACIHTNDLSRAIEFSRRVRSGVAVMNGGTYGSEPHMPFGGVGMSGNGSREPGTEALDIYSNLKDIYLFTNPERLK